jgi:NAD(P)-dependent dehydrogenase (short-subunit alcohol dehydrogenase family)
MNILITGGSNGLGKEIVEKLAADTGNFIYFTYNSSIKEASAIEEKYSNVRAINCDFSDLKSVSRLIDFIPNMKLHVLLNNAYVSIEKQHFHKIKSSLFLDSFSKNVLPVLMLTQQVIDGFRKNKFGKIINILSSYSIGNPPIGLSEYIANKAYILSMSKSWANENIKFNITSNCISPSFMLTKFTSDTDDRVLDDLIQKHPLKKLITPSDVIESILFLINSTQHLNGINLVMNAGQNIN